MFVFWIYFYTNSIIIIRFFSQQPSNVVDEPYEEEYHQEDVVEPEPVVEEAAPEPVKPKEIAKEKPQSDGPPKQGCLEIELNLRMQKTSFLFGAIIKNEISELFQTFSNNASE